MLIYLTVQQSCVCAFIYKIVSAVVNPILCTQGTECTQLVSLKNRSIILVLDVLTLIDVIVILGVVSRTTNALLHARSIILSLFEILLG